jgi:hypothetical protein
MWVVPTCGGQRVVDLTSCSVVDKADPRPCSIGAATIAHHFIIVSLGCMQNTYSSVFATVSPKAG